MGTIPASELVQVLPSVLPAGGSPLALNGIMLTTSTQPPIGQVLSFPSAAAVGAYFGLASKQYAEALVYFAGFNGATSVPGAMLVAQYPLTAVSAYLRGGNASALLSTLQGVSSGNIEVIVDGFSWKNNAINLTSATSLSGVASILQSDLALPSSASFTASIAPSPLGNQSVMTVSAVASGVIAIGQTLAGSGVASGTYISGYGTGSGGTGTYFVTNSQTVASEPITASASAASFTGSIGARGVMTVTAIGSGEIQPGMLVAGIGVAAGTAVVSQITGTDGGDGTYQVSIFQIVSSESLTAAPASISVTFDPISQGFVIESGLTGAASTVSYGMHGLATIMLLTQATGAQLSQGSIAATPGVFMAGIPLITQNWASFWTDFDPDGGVGNAQKLAFAQWVSTTNNRYAYIAWDTDVTPTQGVPATSSLGYLLQQGNYSGTVPIWNNTDNYIAAFIAGAGASINFAQTNGRITFAFKGQSGLVAAVSDPITAVNLAGNPQVAGSYGNGYNFYGAYATANQTFVQYQRGTVSGPFQWYDTYFNQIWLNNAIQLALMILLSNTTSIPYNDAGYAMIETALADPINAAVNFGAIRAGVTLSSTQIAEVNAAAGLPIDNVLSTVGWYLQVLDAQPTIRQGRASPPITFWYCDGESIQAITVASIVLQ